MQALITRTDLLDRLDHCQEHQLTYLVAPAGSGKTTLLEQWRTRRAPALTMVMHCTQRHDSPIHFFQRFLTLVKKRVARVDLPTFDLFRTELTQSPDATSAAVLHALETIDDELLIILDNFHEVRSTGVHQTIFRMLRMLPSNIRFLIASREYPHFSLSHFRLTHKLALIEATDLRLDQDQIQTLNLQLGGQALSPHQLEQLAHQTEGWMVGVKLALLAYAQSGPRALQEFNGRRPELIDYFGHMVLAGLDKSTRLFFLRTAIFDRFSADLCDFLFDRGDSAQVINLWVNQGMFVYPLGKRPGWYRYHSLLQDFLRDRLRVEIAPEEIESLHRQAAEFFLRQRELELALHHARQLGDEALFLQMLEHACEVWVRQGDFASLMRWLEQLPEAQLLGRLSLAIPLLFTLIFTRRFNQAEYYLGLIRDNARISPLWKNTSIGVLTLSLQLFQNETEFLTSLDADALINSSNHTDIRAFSGVIMAYYLLQHGDLTAALRAAHRAKAVLSRTGYVFLESYADLIISLCDRYMGHGQRTVPNLKKAYARACEQTGSPAWVNLATGMVVVHYERNDTVRARQLCERLLPRVNYASATEVIATVYLSLARLLHLDGQQRKASRILEQLTRILMLGQYERLQSQVAQEAMRQAVSPEPRSANCALVDRLARRYGLPIMIEQGFFRQEPGCQEAWERYGLAASYWLVARGDYRAADSILAQIVRVLDGLGIRARALVATCNRVVIRYLRGDSQQAVRMLQQALEEYGLGCVSRSLFDEAPGLDRVFRLAQATRAVAIEPLTEIYAEFVMPSAEAMEPSGPDYKLQVAPKESLTAKEQEILGLLSRGMSNSAISEETGVALSTTKWHLKNIYQKLGVSNRTAAIVEARHHRMPERQ